MDGPEINACSVDLQSYLHAHDVAAVIDSLLGPIVSVVSISTSDA